MSNSDTPIGENGKTQEEKELKVTYVDENFAEKFNFEVCVFGFNYEADLMAYFHDQKSDENFELASPEKQAEIRKEANRLGKLKMVTARGEQGSKQMKKEEMEDGHAISTKKADLDKVKRKADQIRRQDAENKRKAETGKEDR